MRSMWKYAATKMGLRKKTPSMDPALTRPRGLYDTRDVDLRKLKRLILAGKLAPCYAAEEARDPDEDPASGADDSESRPELEECPICFLGYPCLNRSKCCASSICTECFLQVKAPEPRLTPRCPFCKTPGYSVRFKGKKTASERATEAEEEASVAAARERFRAEQLRLERERADARRSAARIRASAEDPSDDPSSSRATASSSSPPSAAATTPNASASASASPIPVVPVGWEEEYAAMTPQRRNPEALRRAGRSWTPPAPPSPLPSVPSRWRAEADERRVRTLDRSSVRSGAFALGSSVSAHGRGRGESGGDRPRRLSSPSPRRLDDSDDPRVDAVGVRFDEEYREVEDERAEAREASRRRERRAARARRRDRDAGPEDALDPEYLRRIQEYVPAHLLDDPPPRETLVAAGNLDIEDVMMMEALYLSLRDGEEEDERRRREEAEAAAEAAEVEAAIAAVAAVEAAEAAEAAARRARDAVAASGEEFAESKRVDEHERVDERVDEHADGDDDSSSSTAALDAEAERVTRLRMSSGGRGGSSAVRHEHPAEARRVAAATRREDGREERDEGEPKRERERGFRADASAGGEGSSSKARVVDPGPPEAPDNPEDSRPARAPAKTSAAEAVERAAAETEAVAMQMEALHARADELERAEASVEALLERLYAEESPGMSRGERDAPEPELAVVPGTDVRARTRTVLEDEETTGEAREAPHPSANEPEPEPEPEPEGETETGSIEPEAEAEAEAESPSRGDPVADRAETA